MQRTVSAALLLSVGCWGAPDVRTPKLGFEVPPRYVSTASTAEPVDLDRWWRSFHDPALEPLIAEAIAHNQDLQAAAARVDAAAAQAVIARAAALPQADASFAVARSRQVFLGIPIPSAEGGVLSSETTIFSANLNVRWELDLWGRIAKQHAAALAGAEAAAAARDAAELSIAARTARSWFQLTSARRQLLLSEATLDNRRRSERYVRRRYERGLVEPLDLRLAISDRAVAEVSVHRRRRAVHAAARGLQILLGRYPGGDARPAPTLPAAPTPAPAGLPASLLARRPDIAEAERNLAAKGAEKSATHRAFLPRIDLTGSIGRQSRQLSELVNGDELTVWSVDGEVRQPLFRGLELFGRVDAAGAREREALAQYRQTVLNAFSEVEQALTNGRSLRNELGALEEASSQAAAAQALAERRYREGLEDFTTVLQAQTRAFVAERDLLQGQLAVLESQVDLYLALGGGFDRGRE